MQNKSKFKVNELTRIQGGYCLVVKKKNGDIQYTVNTKSPYHYLQTVIPESIKEGNPVESAITASGEIVYAHGEFTPKFLRIKVKDNL